MATGYIYNGHGDFDEKDGVKGVALSYAGKMFFIPYQGVLAIPNWIFREVDHDRSTPSTGEVGVVSYMNTMVSGDRIVRELTEGGKPHSAKEMGIIAIEGKATGRIIVVPAGSTAEGEPVTTEVQEKEATKAEAAAAERASEAYMKARIADYFQSKRERMTGGTGRLHPSERERQYMEKLGVEDIDDVGAHQKSAGGLDPEVIRTIMEVSRESNEINGAKLLEAVATVRRRGKAQLTAKDTLTVSPLTEEEKSRRKAIGERLTDARKAKRNPAPEPVAAE